MFLYDTSLSTVPTRSVINSSKSFWMSLLKTGSQVINV
jgi:hypothetical protein